MAMSTGQSLISEIILTNISEVDYYFKNFTLTFAPGETSHEFVVEVVNDDVPEVDEVFSVQLQEPVGGARLGEQNSADIAILTNDGAHGFIGFALVCKLYYANFGDRETFTENLGI